MSAPFLSLQFFSDDDQTGKLVARAAADGFSGESSAWFGAAEVETFARAIADIPLATNPPPSIVGGYFASPSSPELEQEHLGITVCPLDGLGHIGVQVRLATPLERGTRIQSRLLVQLEIVTTCEPLGRFGRELMAVLEGNRGEAVLTGDR